MAFSGARGNMSQVRQLVGMRGLMSDQEGKIIDLPIRTNFREGLSSIDYIISSYGARKGIVDTALKTADSGYLTRRLIYIAQDLIIREINCSTTNGIIILVNSNTNLNNIIGRQIINATSLKKEKEDLLFLKDIMLTETSLNLLKKHVPLTINVRSPLGCKSNGSICQKCYGWDLAQQTLISLGADVNGKGNFILGFPLTIAINEGHFNIVKLLVDNGVNIYESYGFKLSAIEEARLSNDFNIRNYFEEIS